MIQTSSRLVVVYGEVLEPSKTKMVELLLVMVVLRLRRLATFLSALLRNSGLMMLFCRRGFARVSPFKLAKEERFTLLRTRVSLRPYNCYLSCRDCNPGPQGHLV